MTRTEIQCFELLNKCTFQPGTATKRFVRQMASMADKENYVLSEKQKRYLWQLVYSYRKQHGNKWLAIHAETLLDMWKNEDKLKELL